MSFTEKMKDLITRYYIYIILIMLWGLAAAVSPFFRTLITFSAIIIAAVPIALISLAQNLVILTGNFDLTVGVMASLATAIASETMTYNLALSIIMILGIAAFIGLINGLGVARFKIDSFIMTLGMMFTLTGITYYIRPSTGGSIPKELRDALLYSINGFPVTPFLILILTLIAGEMLLKRTILGREIYAVGGNPESAKLLGINVERVLIKVYILSAIISSIAGLYLAALYQCGKPDAGSPYLFDSFTATFMGGTLVTGGVGDYAGTFAASLIIASLVHVLGYMNVSVWHRFIVKGLLLVSIVGIQQLIILIKRVKEWKG